MQEIQRTSGRTRKPTPYRQRGPAETSKPRPTLADPPDRRVPEVRVEPLPPRKLRRLVEASTLDVLEDDLRQVDALLERWAVTPTSAGGTTGGPPRLAQVQLGGVTRYIPGPMRLDDARTELIQSCINAAPPWVREFVRLWYRQDLPMTAILQELGLRRRESVYPVRRAVLGWCQCAISMTFAQHGLRMPRVTLS